VQQHLALLSEPGFRWLLASRFASGAALTGLRAAVAWQLYELTGSAFQLGLLGAVQFVPALGFSLLGGAVADAYDRRRIAQLGLAVEFGCALTLAWATARGAASSELLFGLVFVGASAAAFENPARVSLLPLLVPRERFPGAVAIHSVVQALAFMSGPALSGLAIGARGTTAAYAGSAALLAAAGIGLARLHPRRPEGERRSVSLGAIRDGLLYLRTQPVLLGCMLLDMFAVIFGGATAMLPIYASEILRVGPTGYGVLQAAMEAGALATSVALVLRAPIERQGRALLIAAALFGAATVVFGLSRWFPLSVAAYAAAGMADQVSVVMRSTVIQLATPDALRGRVSSVNMLFIGASNQLGAVESGFVAAVTSATFSVVSGGIASLVVVAVVALRVPELRRYRALRGS